MLINSASILALSTGFRAVFQGAFDGLKPEWSNIATFVPSTTASNSYAWLGAMPALREWIGDRQLQNLAAHEYTIKNRKFESTVSVPRDAIEDDETGTFNPMFSELGRAAAEHPDLLVFDLLKAGFSINGYDGQFFFDTDHPVKAADGSVGATSNMQAGAGEPWFLMDTSRALKPLIYQERRKPNLVAKTAVSDDNVFLRDEYVWGVDYRGNVGFGFWQMAFGSKAALTKDNFRAARSAMMSFKGDNGQPLGVKPTLLVVGPANGNAARDLILAERGSDGSSNTDRNLVTILETSRLAI